MDRDAALETVFKPVRPPTTFEETVERLGTAIRLGLLPAGSKLPAERNLAARLRSGCFAPSLPRLLMRR